MLDETHAPRRRSPAHHVIASRHRPTVVFVTVCTRGRVPLLATTSMHQAVIDAWASASAWLVGRYVVMPDHVHLFATPGEPPLPLTNWISFWKRMMTRTLGEAIWQEDYWDTTLRDEKHAREKWQYIQMNPVRRGLVQSPEQWSWQGELNELRWR